jgi:hypothetical protein
MKKAAVAFFFLAWIFTACEGAFSTPIKKIIDNPRDYAGKTVTVSGEVKEVFGFFFMKYFVLNDGTAEIVVVTRKPLPKKGSTIRVKGKVNELFTLGETETLVIVEENNEKPKSGN